MASADEDELWRSIVDNYGERASLDDARAEAEPPAQTGTFYVIEPAPVDDEPEYLAERFVPPPAPPVPIPPANRLVAWIGVLGVPALILVLALADLYVAPIIAWASILWFIGGFAYLVWLMPRGPRDPSDDGARL